MKNPIGIYYAYWTQGWDTDFVPYVHKVKGLGFDILEVNAGTVTRMSNIERDRLKNAALEAAIELAYCIGLPQEFDVASADASVRKAGMVYLQDMARMMKYMGHRQLGGIIYGSWPGKLAVGEDKRAAVDRSVASMREVMKVAEVCDAFFNVEVVNRFEQYIMNTAAEAVDYVGRVGSPNCRVLLDSFHLNIEEDDIRQAILTAGDKLGHFHIGETNRRAPGRGRMPWDEIFGALREIRYSGAISMEPFLMPGGEVGRDISVYRDLQDGLDLDAEAKRALEFVRQKLNCSSTL
jgi:D-psicose/D-tagatose/L-ribulose 3-epimerase